MSCLTIIIPFHGDDFCFNRFRIPKKYENYFRLIFIYDGKESNKIINLFNSVFLSETVKARLKFNIKGNGAGGSRNIGIKECTSKYCAFADSDDFIDYDALYASIPNFINYELTFFRSISKFNDYYGQIAFRHQTYNMLLDEYLLNSDKAILKTFYVPWSKVYDVDFLRNNNISFEEVVASNDVMFSIRCLIKANKINISDNCFYTAIDRPNSLTKIVSKQVAISRFDQFLYFNSFLKQNNYEMHPMSSQILLCFKSSFFLGVKCFFIAIFRKYPIFYNLKHVIFVFKSRGFRVFK